MIPFNGAAHTLLQVHLRVITQFADGRLDVATPVALAQDVVLVIVQGGDLAGHPSDVFAEEGDDAEHPDGCRDADPPGAAQLFVYEVAEGRRLIHLPIAEEVLASRLSFLQGQEDGLHHVGDIDEGDVLTLEAYGEVRVLLDALGHHEVVALAGTIDAGGAQDDVGEGGRGEGVEPAFSLELAAAILGVGLRGVGLADLLVGLLFADGAEDAERTDIDEAGERHGLGRQCADEILRPLGIDAAEVGLVETLGDAGGVNHIVEVMTAELLAEPFFGREVELDEVDALVLQVLPRAAATHGSPRLHSPAESLFDDEGADETAGSGN